MRIATIGTAEVDTINCLLELSLRVCTLETAGLKRLIYLSHNGCG